MKFTYAAATDVGNIKQVNQDSILIKKAKYKDINILMAIVCDGMGGLAKGELASATVIREFSEWFNKELPKEMKNFNLKKITQDWSMKLIDLNDRIMAYGKVDRLTLGTTFSGLLIVDDQFAIVHVGDTRVYSIQNSVKQLTEDHTFIQREMKKGTMTKEEAMKDKRRNVLLQCIGASNKVTPQIITGTTKQNVFMLCSDGFRHVITNHEILHSFHFSLLKHQETIQNNANKMLEIIKSRHERDNISVVVIKVE